MEALQLQVEQQERALQAAMEQQRREEEAERRRRQHDKGKVRHPPVYSVPEVGHLPALRSVTKSRPKGAMQGFVSVGRRLHRTQQLRTATRQGAPSWSFPRFAFSSVCHPLMCSSHFHQFLEGPSLRDATGLSLGV